MSSPREAPASRKPDRLAVGAPPPWSPTPVPPGPGREPSRFPAGIVSVTGAFHADDAVEVTGPDGEVFAKGLVKVDAARLKAAAGKQTGELPDGTPHEVIHRDDLVVLP